jgi:acetyl-CoA carboxylase biotin carboxyl carrier protein
MKESQIKRLIKLVEESQIEELEVSRWGKKVRISKKARPVVADKGQTVVAAGADQSGESAEAGGSTEAAAAPSGTAPAAESTAPAGDQTAITSPMVGTFYLTPSPEAEPFVKVGQKIEKGQVICIVEAMKLMNEIESDQSGRIAEILVENAQPVEFGQQLFLLEPA